MSEETKDNVIDMSAVKPSSPEEIYAVVMQCANGMLQQIAALQQMAQDAVGLEADMYKKACSSAFRVEFYLTSVMQDFGDMAAAVKQALTESEAK